MLRITITRTRNLSMVLGRQLSHLVLGALIEATCIDADPEFEIRILHASISRTLPLDCLTAKTSSELIVVVIEASGPSRALDEALVRRAITDRFERSGFGTFGQLMVEFKAAKTHSTRPRRELTMPRTGHASAM